MPESVVVAQREPLEPVDLPGPYCPHGADYGHGVRCKHCNREMRMIQWSPVLLALGVVMFFAGALGFLTWLAH